MKATSPDVQSLMDEAQAQHQEVYRCQAKAVELAAKCGETLRQIKAQTKHGDWEKRCREMEIPTRTASRYMFIDEHRDYWPDQEDDFVESATLPSPISAALRRRKVAR